MADRFHEVVIVGAGIAGSSLATCLARNGVDVFLVDAAVQPKFAIGESTIPYTSALLRLLAERYHVPEFRTLSSFQGVRRHVTISGGIKKNFGFLHHRPGLPVSEDQANQFVIPGFLSDENHLFRQDIDTFLLNTAVKYGAHVQQGIRVTDVSFDSDSASVTCEGGDVVRTNYVVDASGLKSKVVEKAQLLEDPPRFEHDARSLFTHMAGVVPFEETDDGRAMKGIPSKWSQGTLHHVFDGGWIWVIPFNNWENSANSLVSVGLTLDRKKYPNRGADPEAEFRTIIAQFPSVKAQFDSAVAVRPWVSTGRLQHSLSATVGERFCATAHAAGFIDALFSRGLCNTFLVINSLADRLIAASRDGDYSTDRFKFIETLEQQLLDYNDDLVHGSFVAFRDYELWNAYFRVWGLITVLGTFDLQGRISRLRNGDESGLRELENLRWPGSLFPGHVGANTLLSDTKAIVAAFERGELSGSDAAGQVFDLLRSAQFIPATMGFSSPEQRFFHMTPPKAIKTLRWAKNDAPADISNTILKGIRSIAGERLHG